MSNPPEIVVEFRILEFWLPRQCLHKSLLSALGLCQEALKLAADQVVLAGYLLALTSLNAAGSHYPQACSKTAYWLAADLATRTLKQLSGKPCMTIDTVKDTLICREQSTLSWDRTMSPWNWHSPTSQIKSLLNYYGAASLRLRLRLRHCPLYPLPHDMEICKSLYMPAEG